MNEKSILYSYCYETRSIWNFFLILTLLHTCIALYNYKAIFHPIPTITTQEITTKVKCVKLTESLLTQSKTTDDTIHLTLRIIVAQLTLNIFFSFFLFFKKKIRLKNKDLTSFIQNAIFFTAINQLKLPVVKNNRVLCFTSQIIKH